MLLLSSIRKHGGLLLFLLGSGGLVLGFLLDRGFIVKDEKALPTVPKSEQLLKATLRRPPKLLQVKQDGRSLRGAYPALSDLESAGEGSYAQKENHVYIRPLPGRPAEFTFAELYDVPEWYQALFSVAALVGLAGMLAQGAAAAGSIPVGQKVRPLDGLRGCACIVVVCFHFCIAVVLHEPFHVENLVIFLKPFPFGVLMAGAFCVQVFFILSGFVLSLPFFQMEKDMLQVRLRSAFVRRPFRLLGVMLPVLILARLLGYGPKTGPFTAAWDLMTSPFAHAVDYVTPLWTLKVELYGSLGLFVGLWVFLGARRVWRACFYVVAFVLLRGTDYLGFLIGAAFADAAAAGRLPQRGRASLWMASVGVAGSLWLASFAQELLMRHEMGDALLDALNLYFPLSIAGASCLVFGALHLVRLQQFLMLRPIQFLGHISYSLYAVHWLVLYSISVPLALWLRKQQGWEMGAAWSLAGLLCLVGVIVLGWLATLGIDKPAIRLSRRIADGFLGEGKARPQEVPRAATAPGDTAERVLS